MSSAEIARIWQHLATRGYRYREDKRTMVEVVDVGTDQVANYQVRFYYDDSPTRQLSGTYEQILPKIAQLPMRQHGLS
jgi:hypothetical protein